MSELRGLLEDTVARLFSERVSQSAIEEAEAGHWPAELWRVVEEHGLTRPHLPEARGGAGGSWNEAFPVVWASGRFSAPLPLAETMLASWLLERAGITAPDGPLTILPAPVGAAALRGDTLDAEAADVPWGRHAKAFVFLATDGAEMRVGLVPRGDTTSIDALDENLAREPRDSVRFAASPIAALGTAPLAADRLLLYGAMLRSAQMAGALQALLDQSVQYANERIQFGRPIGKFQIIQQQLAVLAGYVAACNTAAESAFAAAARATDPAFEIAVAKILSGDCVDEAAGIAHQVHGAIGFTYEHSLHFSTRRLWSWRAEFDSNSAWAERLGSAILARGARALWPDLTLR